MKILIFLSQYYELGGAEKLEIDLAMNLGKIPGVQVDVLSMYTGDLGDMESNKNKFIDSGVNKVSFLGLKPNPNPMSFLLAIFALRKILTEDRYDVVETSLLGPTILASFAVKGLKTKHVAGIHAVFESAMHNSLKHRLWKASVQFNKKTYFYAVSNAVLESWLNFSQTDRSRTRLIYNSISDDFFQVAEDRDGFRKELGIGNDCKIILYVGGLVKYKGIDTLLKAAGPFLAELNCHLVYVGKQKQFESFYAYGVDIIDQMKNIIAEKKWDSHIHFLGERRDISRIMAASDILVHIPMTEGFGIVLAEALAAGLAIVATDVGGIAEVVQNSQAILVPVGDVDATQKAIKVILTEDTVTLRKNRLLGKVLAEKFSLANRTAAMLNFFKELLA